MGAFACGARAWPGRRFALLVVLVGVLTVLWAVPIRPGVVLGESMSPSFHSGQVFLMSRLGDMSALEPGDVVVLNVDGELYLKRVFAAGGQIIWGLESSDVDAVPDMIVSPLEVEKVRTLVRGRPGMGRVVNITVPPGHVFVVGDSDGNSCDSRHFGPVPMEAILGRVVIGRVFRLWRAEQSGSGVFVAGAMARQGRQR